MSIKIIKNIFPNADIRTGDATLREWRQSKNGLFPKRKTPGCREMDIREFIDERTIILVEESAVGHLNAEYHAGAYGEPSYYRSEPWRDMQPIPQAEIVAWAWGSTSDSSANLAESHRWQRWLQATWLTVAERDALMDASLGNPFWPPKNNVWFPVECTFCMVRKCPLRIAGYTHSNSDHLYPDKILAHPKATDKWREMARGILRGDRDKITGELLAG